MSYQLLSESKPKARKEHRCVWCYQKIIIGETYRREKSVYDGEIQNFAWHLECDEACKEEYKISGECEFSPGENDRPPRKEVA